ncbi:MAG: hypothetical protein ACK5IP_11575 [Paracoccus sp. (in: a-proteobacteria)]
MKRLTDRRALIMAAGTLTAAAVVGSVAAQSGDIRGTVVYEGGVAIPRGHISISIEDSAAKDSARARAPTAGLESNGGAKALSFTLPADLPVSPGQEIVVLLEREDGWLLARGSAPVVAGVPADIMLYTVMY